MPGGEARSRVILVVDDSDSIRRMVCAMLRQGGFEIVEAAHGVAALEVLEQAAVPVDLVLTDIMMPEMGGVELAERLSRSRPRLPVVFMTGYMDDPSVKQLGAHPAPLLRKPFAVGELLASVRNALGST